MLNSRQIEHVESELFKSLMNFIVNYNICCQIFHMRAAAMMIFPDGLNRKKIKKNTQIPVKFQTVFSFFEGCRTKAEADKRYRALAKAFHPDTGCGDENMFNKMKEEYDNLHLS